MTSTVAAFAQSASLAFTKRAGFEATQIIESGGLRIEAHIRKRGSRFLDIEYKSYQSPWSDLQEALSGQLELIGEELCGQSLSFDGKSTWLVDPSADTAIHKAGPHLFEPIPGLATLGEFSFLETLTRDFLLRDLGEETVDDQGIRRIGLKPKTAYRSQLLSAVVFPIRTATIDFDTETYFPVSISFVPSSESPAASILGPNATVRILYRDVRISDSDATFDAFSPPAGTKVFKEKAISADELDKQSLYSIPPELLREHGFNPDDGMAVVTVDAENDRSYATIQYEALAVADEDEATPHPASDSQDETLTPRLTIMLGNYVSRNMARRRASFSEEGQPASDPLLPIKLLDRKKLWEQKYPGIDTRYAPVDTFFEKEGVYWFLSGTGIELDSMEAIAKDLLERQPEAELESEPRSE